MRLGYVVVRKCLIAARGNWGGVDTSRGSLLMNAEVLQGAIFGSGWNSSSCNGLQWRPFLIMHVVVVSSSLKAASYQGGVWCYPIQISCLGFWVMHLGCIIHLYPHVASSSPTITVGLGRSSMYQALFHFWSSDSCLPRPCSLSRASISSAVHKW